MSAGPDPSVPGALNLRDVGGLRAGAGVTRSGVLFRSGDLSRLDAAGAAALGDLGVRHVVDLRADDEVAFAPSRLGGLSVTTQRVPLLLGSVASFFEADLNLREMYRRLVDESAAGVIEVVRAVATEPPVLVHCTVGKDRTGVTVALALAAAGVDEDAIVADYARTETLLPEARNTTVLRYLRSTYPDARNLEELATRSPAPVMRGLLDDLTARFGSPIEYLSAHGLSDDEVGELRRVLIADPG